MLNILFEKNDNRQPSIMEASFSFTFCVVLYKIFNRFKKKQNVKSGAAFDME